LRGAVDRGSGGDDSDQTLRRGWRLVAPGTCAESRPYGLNSVEEPQTDSAAPNVVYSAGQPLLDEVPQVEIAIDTAGSAAFLKAVYDQMESLPLEEREAFLERAGRTFAERCAEAQKPAPPPREPEHPQLPPPPSVANHAIALSSAGRPVSESFLSDSEGSIFTKRL
jgi:hypothetical protein